MADNAARNRLSGFKWMGSNGPTSNSIVGNPSKSNSCVMRFIESIRWLIKPWQRKNLSSSHIRILADNECGLTAAAGRSCLASLGSTTASVQRQTVLELPYMSAQAVTQPCAALHRSCSQPASISLQHAGPKVPWSLP